jgi:hypothetical protein
MTAAQVLSSCWGKPRNAADSVTAEGKVAVWGYPEGFIYLTNDIVTRITTVR